MSFNVTRWSSSTKIQSHRCLYISFTRFSPRLPYNPIYHSNDELHLQPNTSNVLVWYWCTHRNFWTYFRTRFLIVPVGLLANLCSWGYILGNILHSFLPVRFTKQVYCYNGFPLFQVLPSTIITLLFTFTVRLCCSIHDLFVNQFCSSISSRTLGYQLAFLPDWFASIDFDGLILPFSILYKILFCHHNEQMTKEILQLSDSVFQK